MILLIENRTTGEISAVILDRYAKSDESEKKLYEDANNLYGYAMSQYLPSMTFDLMVKLVLKPS